MEIHYELTPKDFRQALATHRNKVTLRRWPMILFLVIMLLMLGFGIFSVVIDPTTKALANNAPLFAILALWTALIFLWPSWSGRTQFRNQPSCKGPRTVLIDSSGIRSQWDGGDSNIQWKNYIRWVESGRHFLFYTHPRFFNVLPKSALTTDQIDELRALAKENISAKK